MQRTATLLGAESPDYLVWSVTNCASVLYTDFGSGDFILAPWANRPVQVFQNGMQVSTAISQNEVQPIKQK